MRHTFTAPLHASAGLDLGPAREGRGADAPAGAVLAAAGPSWSAWSRAAVRLMQARNANLEREHGLSGRGYRFTLDSPWLVLRSQRGQVVADICVIGSLSAARGTFRWAWADQAIPAQARHGLERVREFGEMNGLDELTTPEAASTRAQAFELAAVAARILNAAAVWAESSGDLTLLFALSNVRPV
jgi:hypothetical protein